MIWVGTSGWQYRDWRGAFYPPGLEQSDWLPWFSERVPTVEVNNTFYRMPSEATFDAWRERSAGGFVLAVKASRYITHVKRLGEPGPAVELLWSRCERLGDKLGPVLFQLPPTFKADVGRLRGLLEVLPSRMRPAFEFRHPSWDGDDVRGLLDAAGAAWVLADRPGVHITDHVTGGWSYMRFHQGNPHGPDYTREKLKRWADRIAALSSDDVWIYFNNDPTGAALRDAVTLTELLRKRTDVRVRGPAPFDRMTRGQSA